MLALKGPLGTFSSTSLFFHNKEIGTKSGPDQLGPSSLQQAVRFRICYRHVILKQSHPTFHTNPDMKHMAGLFSSKVKGSELRGEEGSVANCASRPVREQWEMPEGASLELQFSALKTPCVVTQKPILFPQRGL